MYLGRSFKSLEYLRTDSEVGPHDRPSLSPILVAPDPGLKKSVETVLSPQYLVTSCWYADRYLERAVPLTATFRVSFQFQPGALQVPFY